MIKSTQLLVSFLLFMVIGCSHPETRNTANPDVDYYTCTMHPSVHQKLPGKCPICSMELVPVMKRHTSETGALPSTGTPPKQSNEFQVPIERQQQIGVTYAKVERKPLRRRVRAVGMVTPDKARHWELVARVAGYVQKLYVTSPGEVVEKDAPLMTIYSPELLTTEREFAALLTMREAALSPEARAAPERLIAAARRRLEQWNMTQAQIAELEKTRLPTETLTLLSPFRGIVEAVPVEQGRNVSVGDHLIDVDDLARVWVWADFYEGELSALHQGQKVEVTAHSFPDQIFNGEISLINPFVDDARRTTKIRVEIANPDFKLKPGMFANVELEIDLGEGLTVPAGAVMPTGARSLVFVDHGEGRIEPRAVELGAKFGDLYQVRNGLREGEQVIASANFLIDAEAKVQGALNDFTADSTSGKIN